MLFACLAFLILLVPSAHAAGTCGEAFSGTGTCSGGLKTVSCDMLSGGCCDSAITPGCDWQCIGEECNCQSEGGSSHVWCESFVDNQAGCNAFSSFGCTWVPTSTDTGCVGIPGGNGFGEACGTGCASCLVCVSGKCAQRPGICTTIPAEYVAPPPVPAAPGAGIDPSLAIANLESGTGNAAVGSGSGIYKVGWFSDWRVTGLIGVAIVCSIIALAAMIGNAFNIPTIKAFANNEIKQAVISALILVSLVGLISFFNEVAVNAVNGADLPVACNPSEPCYISAAKYYLTTLEDTANKYANNTLRESIVKAKRASYGKNLNFNKIYFLFAGTSVRENAGDSLVAERYGAMFMQASKMLASLSAQKYFIDVITFGIAPLFILLGVVLRTFFFTRKLGGLLLALAISLFFIYPLTFVFAWYTLNVTVYGERTLAVADPNCPQECTGTYPVAFFTNSNGELVQFSTTQSIMRAGINKSNWNLGGPDLNPADGSGDFPGLVACRNLSSIGIPSTTALNTCGSCPDYCRDVPFPTNMPGCNITDCANCNPGCKIVRQRLDCQTDPACAGKCPDICRTRIPLENKCFSNEKGGAILADLSISCAGCSKYPAWCRFLKNDSGILTPAYNDAACKSGSVDVSNDATCPQQCSYITSIGTDDTCDSICSFTDAKTGAKTVCPEECRVTQLLTDPAWVSTYDLDPPNFALFCNENPQRAAACARCGAHPECLVTAFEAGALPEICAPYPTTDPHVGSCLSCPDYCRRGNFTDYFEPYSMVDRRDTGEVILPAVCDPFNVEGMNCSTTGNPPACSASCLMDQNDTPLICRPYDPGHVGDIERCKACPDMARFKVDYTKSCSPITPAAGGEYSIILSGPGSGQLASGLGKASAASQSISGNDKQTGAGTIWLAGAAPTVTSVYLSLPGPYGTSPILGFCTGTDPTPGDTLSYDYILYRNGAEYASGSTASSTPSGAQQLLYTIPPPQTLGDTWYVSCRASDGTTKSTYADSSELTVGGSPPPPNGIQIISVYISPDPAYTTSSITGYCTGTDAGGAQLQYNYTYYRNGIANVSGQTSASPSGSEVTLPSISPPLILGNTWSVSCNAFNGTDYSGASTSGGVEVVTLATTTISSNITPTDPYRIATLEGHCNVTDSTKSKIIQYEYQWYKTYKGIGPSLYKSGTSSALQGVDTVIASLEYSNGDHLLKNQVWVFSCRGIGSTTSSWLDSAPVTILQSPPEAPCTNTPSDIALNSADTYRCDDASCPEALCQSIPLYVTLPNQDSRSECSDSNVTDCPYGCRVLGPDGQLDSYLNTDCYWLCEDLYSNAPWCFVQESINAPRPGVSPNVSICSEYIGNGAASCHSSVCISLSEDECEQAGTGCTWNAPQSYCDRDVCAGKSESDCNKATANGCQWMYTYDSIAIGNRVSPYDQQNYCRQCPEQCRVDSYTGSCGVENNGIDAFVDCSMGSCPSDCRIPEPLPSSTPPHSECQPYPEDTGKSCAGCPALCRRKSDFASVMDGCQEYPGCLIDSNSLKGCSEECGMENPPNMACQGCTECDIDCTYYPAIRTDCSNICSDEALSGPINIEPDDFIKSLPGAKTAYTDVKNIGVLYIPAVLLPLFCIVIVVAFVRILSPILGGDIEIPGLGRII
jgi:hypothetical protein